MQYIAIAAGLFLLFYTLKTEGDEIKMSQANKPQYDEESINEILKKHGRKKGIDWKLLKAVAIVESNLKVQAYNPNDPSYGLMQLLCYPDETGNCGNNLNVNGWPPEDPNRLFDPDYNVHIGSQILKWNIDNYGFKRGIATYNAWKAHKAPKDGPFPNQSYVDKVLSEYAKLGGKWKDNEEGVKL